MHVQDAPHWHLVEPAPLFDALASSPRGLSSAEAASRLRRDGINALPDHPPPSAFVVFARQFHSPLIYVLAGAAVLSIAIDEHTDAVFIAAVLLLNALIGSIQEWKAERSNRALQKLLHTRTTVRRDGDLIEIDAQDVVQGDIVYLESGNRVPADVRLLETHGLEIDESLLTGESLPILKSTTWKGEVTAVVGDRKNMAYASTTVVRGRGIGLVVATALKTVVGELALDVTGTPAGKPPLVVRMDRFTRVVAFFVLAAVGVIALIGIFFRGIDPAEMLLFAVALAVSAIPEGLPVALTVALAVAASRMAKRGVIARKLAAVEGLGSCSMIATDKTGTLTCNELTVRLAYLPGGQRYRVTGEGYAPEGHVVRDALPTQSEDSAALEHLVRAAVLCNEASLRSREGGGWTWRGDPTDVALLSFGQKLGWSRDKTLEQYPEVDTIPFEPERRYAASFHQTGATTRVFVKGSPEQVLERCTLEEGSARNHLDEAAALAREGYRVLACADAEWPGHYNVQGQPTEPRGLRFLGLVGMIDPLRPGVREAVADCASAGVHVSMVTGDHPETALAIARELGLAEDRREVLTGAELSVMEEQELRRKVQKVRVFARTTPEQKLNIVRAARDAGHFVAVTGDGVNDAPALRAAHISVAMGKDGTDVAREAAELVITDDNFATIVSGIEEGRVAFDNIRKVIYLLISTGAAEIVMILLSFLFGVPLPLLAVQLLWLNLVTNGIQDVALAFEPAESDTLKRAPRATNERIFDRLMIERTVVAALVMGIVGFAVFRWMLDAGWPVHDARNGVLLLMVLFENLHLGNSRSETRSIFSLSPLKSPILLAGAALAFGIHVLAMHWPFMQGVLGTAPVSLNVWLALFATALSIVVVMEIHKWLWKRRKQPRTLQPIHP